MPNAKSAEVVVDLIGVHKSYGELQVLNDVNYLVHEGEVCVVVGASGSGKSTLLRCINALEPIDKGIIRVSGTIIGCDIEAKNVRTLSEAQIAPQRRTIGMVFQQFNLFPTMTALANVMIGPVRVKRIKPAIARKTAMELLDRVGLSDRMDHYPNQLSGGQQQRVAIARAMAMEPKLMLFDEPTSALDPELVGEVLTVIADLARSGMTMLIVTHEMQFVNTIADRVGFMHQGRLLEEGPAAELLAAPKTPELQAFLRHVNLESNGVSHSTTY